MAIELKLTGPCDGCPGFELRTEKLYTGGRPNDRAFETFAFCDNRKLCQHIERHLMKYMDEHPYTGPDPLELDI